MKLPRGEVKRILVLGGWSSGPLPRLKRYLLQNWSCAFVEPPIPMPPFGVSWLLQLSTLAFVGVLTFIITSYVSICTYESHNWVWEWSRWIVLIMVTLFGCGLLRLCAAWIVRQSIDRGVLQAKRYLPEVDVVIGFSWGGCIIAELLHRGLLIPDRHAAVLIAPTTALVARFALQPDLASVLVIHNQSHAHVFHGRHDALFCPNADLWEGTGATLHWCNDNHAFLREESIEELCQCLSVDIIPQ